MRYKAVKTEIIDVPMDSHEWEKAKTGYVGVNRWNGYAVAPITTFRMLHGPEGISVLMCTEEKNLRCECTEENGSIYQDSCMEFFFKPDVLDINYFNFEFNPKGVLHLAIGNGRHGRVLLNEDRKTFSIDSRAKDGDWRIKFYIPHDFILKHFEKISPVCKGNFYKCGDMTDHVHYGTWSEVEVPEPDYHVPDFFGKIEL